MARVALGTVKSWAEPTKLNITTFDNDLLENIEVEVLARIQGTHDTTGWTTPANTPKLIRTIIAKMYVSWFYARQYSEDSDTQNSYATKLGQNAEMLILGIINNTIVMDDVPGDSLDTIAYYPTDASSAMDPLDFPEDPSVGPAAFSMTMRL